MAEKMFSAEQIERGTQELMALAQQPKTQFTSREAVEAMYDAIAEALQNHGYDEVAQQLHAAGIRIARGTLKNYFLEIQRERSGQKGQKKRSSTRSSKSSTSATVSAKAGNADTTKKKSPLPESSDDIKLAY